MGDKHKLKVRLFVDAEADFYYNIPSPHFSRWDMLKWRLNKLAGRMWRYPQPSRQGFVNLIECFKRYEQPATLCITGHLYLKGCKGFPHYQEAKPKHPWYKSKIGRNWYYWDTGGNYKTFPGRYFGDIIERESKNELFDFGLHAFAHEALTLESQSDIESFVASGIRAAAERGILIQSFACPFEMTSDEGDRERVFNVLRKYGVKRVFHAGQDNGLKIKRFFAVNKPINAQGLEKIWISEYFEGTSKKSHIKRIINEIWRNRDRDVVYCLGTHDFTHKNADNLATIIRFLKKKGFS